MYLYPRRLFETRRSFETRRLFSQCFKLTAKYRFRRVLTNILLYFWLCFVTYSLIITKFFLLNRYFAMYYIILGNLNEFFHKIRAMRLEKPKTPCTPGALLRPGAHFFNEALPRRLFETRRSFETRRLFEEIRYSDILSTTSRFSTAREYSPVVRFLAMKSLMWSVVNSPWNKNWQRI